MPRKPRSETPVADSAAPPSPPVEAAGTAQTESPGDKAPLAELLTLKADEATDEQLQDIVNRHMAWELGRTDLSPSHNVVVLYDSLAIDRSDSNRIYQSLGEVDTEKPILLMINSPGGDIAAAYFISKLCREYTKKSFEVAVPREAKSAATLICCGADRIHMGSLSELGPI